MPSWLFRGIVKAVKTYFQTILMSISILWLTSCFENEYKPLLLETETFSSFNQAPPSESLNVTTPPSTRTAAYCTAKTIRGSANQSLRKFTKIELINSLKDLVNNNSNFSSIVPEKDFTYTPLSGQAPIQQALNSYSSEYSRVPGEDFENLHDREQFQAWMDVSEAFATTFQERKVYNIFLSAACNKNVNLTENCLSEFIPVFGRKAFRRPLKIEEIASFQKMITASDLNLSLQRIVARFIRSPDFVFKIETGAVVENSRIRLTDYEIASRISYATIASMPDSELSAAADAGELQSLDKISYHVERLLNTSRGQEKMKVFFHDWLRLGEVKQPNGLWANFAMLLDYRDSNGPLYTSNRMDTSYRKETEDFIKGIIWQRKGSFKDLMSLRVAYPREIRTAKVYGVSLSAEDYNNHALQLDGSERAAPDHPGLLTRVALLSSSSSHPNAIMRGVNIKRRILCDEIPSPDFSIVTDRVSDLDKLDPTHSHYPNHFLISKLTSSNSCIGCHSQINPVGYLFESYNPLGQKSLTQKVIAPNYEFRTVFADHMKPEPKNLPAGVSAALLEEYDLPSEQKDLFIEKDLPTSFRNSDDFIDVVSKSKKARACMQVRLFRHFQKRSESVQDACALAEVNQVLNSDEPVIKAIVRTIANEDIFWRKSK